MKLNLTAIILPQRLSVSLYTGKASSTEFPDFNSFSSKELKKLSFDKLANILPWMPEVFSLTSGEECRSSAGRRES